MKINVLIDTDAALDDWLAIAYLVMNPAVNVVGITTTGVGAAHLTPGTKNILGLLAALGRTDILVGKGTSAPLLYSNVYPGSFRTQVDGAYGVTFPANPTTPLPSAVDLASALIAQNPGLTVLSLGGGTNLGALFRAQPGILPSIGQLIVMGGVINSPPGGGNVPGNVNGFNPDYTNAVAEWNMFVDPLGAELMLSAAGKTRVCLVPLNASNLVPLDLTFFSALQMYVAGGGAPLATQLLLKALTTQIDSIVAGQYFFWDPLAAVLVTNPTLASYWSTPLAVQQSLDEENDISGQTVVSATGATIAVAIGVPSPTAIKTTFLASIAPGASLAEKRA